MELKEILAKLDKGKLMEMLKTAEAARIEAENMVRGILGEMMRRTKDGDRKKE